MYKETITKQNGPQNSTMSPLSLPIATQSGLLDILLWEPPASFRRHIFNQLSVNIVYTNQYGWYNHRKPCATGQCLRSGCDYNYD